VSTDTERIASLEQRLAVVEKRLGIVVSDPQPQPTPTPTPPVTRSRDFALFYTDAWEDWQAPGGLRALQSYDTCVIQADFAAAAVDSKGRQYAGGATPLAHLTGKGREVWLYASPWWVDDEARMGGPAEAFRLEKAQMARKTGALVKRNGAPLRVFGGKMLVADPRNGDYTAWLAERMIEIWVMFDEPPHPGGADGKLYGWTPQVEARTLNMGQALRGAGIPFGVCHPNYQSLRFWRSKGLSPDWYILNEKHDYFVYAPYLPKGAKVWVYNVRAASLPRLGERLAEYGALGLVMWHAVPQNKSNQMPLLFDLSRTPPVATEAASMLLAQLKVYTPGGTTPAPAPTLEEQVEALRQEVEELKRALAALQAGRQVYE